MDYKTLRISWQEHISKKLGHEQQKARKVGGNKRETPGGAQCKQLG